MSGYFCKSISVFFPTLNDENTIGTLVGNAMEVLPTLTHDFEILAINDGSSDKTKEILIQLEQKYPQFRAIHHEKNRGYGGALQTGFANSTKELVFYTDGDGQYDVKELEILFNLMTDDVDVVNGYKIKRSDNFIRIAVGEIYRRAVRILFWLPIRDVDCDFRLIRRTMLEKIVLTSLSGCICIELVKKLNRQKARFLEVGVNHYPRLSGKSEFFKLNRLFKTGMSLIPLWFNFFIADSKRNTSN